MDNRNIRAKKQLGFLDFVVTPLWKGVCRLLPGMQHCLLNLEENRRYYVAVADAQEPLVRPLEAYKGDDNHHTMNPSELQTALANISKVAPGFLPVSREGTYKNL
jgi:hypothetical protein